eukprot:11789-Pleurochrysis_carterae.AAC.1
MVVDTKSRNHLLEVVGEVLRAEDGQAVLLDAIFAEVAPREGLRTKGVRGSGRMNRLARSMLCGRS